jgi:hypothetical protein
MGNKGRIFRKILWSLLAVFVIIQFFQPEKNKSGNKANDISLKFSVPQRVEAILEMACYDCHSNKTNYPWYGHLQPSAWWLNGHIVDGKKRLNFNEFSAYRPNRQFNKLEEIEELVANGEMPLESYTWIHRDSKLDANQKEIIINWTKDLRDSMKAVYPGDSLVMPKRK